jgi:nitrite reductase (cytochrome; ammonia-forming)
MKEKRKLKRWQGWALFVATMVVVFCLGLLASSIMQRRAEVASIFANKKVEIAPQEARNALFQPNYPKEYETWLQTADTSFSSEFNGNKPVDVLAKRPEMVIFWAGYSFSRDYSAPRGHYYAIQDMLHTLRTGSPGVDGMDDIQPATCWTCKSPDVPRMMQAMGVGAFYNQKWSAMGSEIVNPIGCADCHDTETMDLRISRPALIEAFRRMGKDITKATHQEMRSLVCA